jgi:hypothetical protein
MFCSLLPKKSLTILERQVTHGVFHLEPCNILNSSKLCWSMEKDLMHTIFRTSEIGLVSWDVNKRPNWDLVAKLFFWFRVHAIIVYSKEWWALGWWACKLPAENQMQCQRLKRFKPKKFNVVPWVGLKHAANCNLENVKQTHPRTPIS